MYIITLTSNRMQHLLNVNVRVMRSKHQLLYNRSKTYLLYF